MWKLNFKYFHLLLLGSLIGMVAAYALPLPKGSSHITLAQTTPIVSIQTPYVTAMAWSHNSEKMAIGYSNGFTSVWTLSNQNSEAINTASLSKPNVRVSSLDFSPDNLNLAVGYSNGAIYIWDLMSVAQLVLDSQEGPIRSLRWDPDGTALAIASAEHFLLWDIAAGTQLMSAQEVVVQLMWSPRGDLVVGRTLDGTLNIWKKETKQPLSILSKGTKKANRRFKEKVKQG